MSKFDQWWDSADNPARNMPESTKQQIKWHMSEAFKAGRRSKGKDDEYTRTQV